MKARLFLLTVLLLFIVGCGSTPTPQIIRETIVVEVTRIVPTYTPYPTFTPIPPSPTKPPTPTVIPPTATPTSTSVPSPTATVKPSPSPTIAATPTPLSEYLEYAQEIGLISEEYREALKKIGSLLAEAEQEPELLFDEDWRTEIDLWMIGILMLGEWIREVQPPIVFADAHADMLEATEHYDNAMLLLAEWLEEFDPTKLQEAVVEMALATQCLKDSTAKFKALQ